MHMQAKALIHVLYIYGFDANQVESDPCARRTRGHKVQRARPLSLSRLRQRNCFCEQTLFGAAHCTEHLSTSLIVIVK